MAILRKEYELSVWDETLGEKGQKKEIKRAIIGALDMDYLYIGARFDDSDEVSPIYINLKEKEKDGVSAE